MIRPIAVQDMISKPLLAWFIVLIAIFGSKGCTAVPITTRKKTMPPSHRAIATRWSAKLRECHEVMSRFSPLSASSLAIIAQNCGKSTVTALEKA
jgi:hypothetical protein